MKYGLNIKPERRARPPFAGCTEPPCRSGHRPFPQGHRMAGASQRRRVQRGRQPGQLLPPAHRHRLGHGGLSHRRSDRRAGAADGHHPLLQAFQAQRRQRPQHGHHLQRPRLRRARAGGLLQPRQRSRRPAQARRLRLECHLRRTACAGSTAAASLPRSPKPPAK